MSKTKKAADLISNTCINAFGEFDKQLITASKTIGCSYHSMVVFSSTPESMPMPLRLSMAFSEGLTKYIIKTHYKDQPKVLIDETLEICRSLASGLGDKAGLSRINRFGKLLDELIMSKSARAAKKIADDFSYFMKQTDGEYRHYFAVISSAYEVEVKKLLGLCA